MVERQAGAATGRDTVTGFRTTGLPLALLTVAIARPAAAVAQATPSPLSRPVDYEPAWSPDGRHLAFISNRTGALKLWTMAADGSDPRQLTTGVDEDDAPAWSPDGRRIAYVSMRGGDAEIFVVNADGTAPRRLTTSPGDDIHPQWSPDGRRLLFKSARRSRDPAHADVYEVFTMRPDGSDVRPLTHGGIATYASLSPDGTRLVYRRQLADGNSEIVVRGLEDSVEVNISRHPAFDGWPAWSRDGRRIVYARESEDGTAVILQVNADGTGEMAVVTGPGRNTNPRWPPVRDQLVFSRRVEGLVRLHIVDVP